MIEHADSLSIIAEVSAVFVGFIGVIVVLGGRWSRGVSSALERLMLSTLLLTSFTNLGVALLPLVLAALVPDHAIVWRIANGCLGFAMAALLLRAMPMAGSFRDFGLPLVLMPPIMLTGVVTHGVGIAIGLGFFAAVAPFALLWGLYWGLFVCAFTFSNLLYLTAIHFNRPQILRIVSLDRYLLFRSSEHPRGFFDQLVEIGGQNLVFAPPGKP